jgi:hypothetical protein
MPIYRFRIDEDHVGVVSAPTKEMALEKIVRGANQREWFSPELSNADVAIEGQIWDHVTLFTEETTLGF